MKKIISAFVLSIVFHTAFSQWVADSSVNEEVSSYTSSVILSSPTSDGGTFISFYKPNASGFYDMVVQYLNPNGIKQFGDDGIILTSYPANTATFVYNVMTDAQDNFIVCFQDQRNSQANAVVAYKISKTGLSLWETNPGTGDGLYLGAGLSPYPCQLSNGDYIIAWNATNNKIDYQKITAAGTVAWASPLEINPITTGRTISRPQLVPHTLGKWGMVFQQRNGTVGSPTPTTLYEKQFDSDGNTLWTSSALSNYVTANVRYYSVLSVGDVTYIGYYANPNLQNRFDGFVQRVNGDGTLPWGINGSDFSTEQVNYEMVINIVYNALSAEIWAVETYTNTTQTNYGIYTQRFNATSGARQLSDNAKLLFPISANREQTWPTNMGLCDASNLMFMFYSDVSNFVFASKINLNGDLVWPTGKIVVGGTANAKGRYNFSVAGGEGVAVWQETRSGNTRAYAQNIACAGNIGPIPVKVEYFRGARQGSNHLLEWKVSPVNTQTATMYLERSSDGRYYTAVYTISATALRMMQPFSYTDDHPVPGINYYRIRSVDDNGMITYSSIVALLNEAKGFKLVSISPNPVNSGKLKANISTSNILNVHLLITDAAGRIVQSKTENLITGFNSIGMDINNLPAGTYQLHCLTNDSAPAVLRFVKQ